MKNTRKNTIILIAILAFLAAVLLIWQVFLRKDDQIVPKPTPVQLKLLNTEPPSGKDHATTSSISAINFTFNDQVKPDSVSFIVNPQIKLHWQQSLDGKTLSFYPLEPWQEKVQYQLVIDKKLSSISGSQLQENIVYLYKYSFIQGE